MAGFGRLHLVKLVKLVLLAQVSAVFVWALFDLGWFEDLEMPVSDTEIAHGLRVQKGSGFPGSLVAETVPKIPILMEPNVNCTTKMELLVAVISRADDFEKRQFVRDTWGAKLKTCGTVDLIFVIGKQRHTDSHASTQHTELEHHSYNDILQGHFIDSYYNLTLKHLTLLQFLQNCQNPKFFYTLDDDALVIPENLLRFLRTDTTKRRQAVIYGSCWSNGSPVNRKFWHKNYVPRSVYALNRYPAFCRGIGHIMSRDVPAKLLAALLNSDWLFRFAQVEDVLFTGFLRMLANISVVDVGPRISSHSLSICKTSCIGPRHSIIQIGDLKTPSEFAQMERRLLSSDWTDTNCNIWDAFVKSLCDTLSL